MRQQGGDIHIQKGQVQKLS